jgi:hypothetical protein
MRQASETRASGVIAIAALLLGFVAACGGTTAATSTPTASAVGASASPTETASAVAPSTPDMTAGWVSYTSPANHLTFQHPPDMQPLECGWAFIDPTNPSSCPQGDGQCCVFLRSSDNGETGAMSLISDHTNLYPGGIERNSVTVDGVTGTRLSGIQTIGQGGGPQVEYDFTTNGRTYNFFAYVGGSPTSLEPGAPSPSLFDQIVQTVVFTS